MGALIVGSGPELPSGTVTFLFTDIEGSTRLLKQLGQERYGEVLGEHSRILRAIFAAHGGQVVDTQGDSFFVAFRRAREAVAAALDAQRGLSSHDWPDGAPVHVRVGLHTGEPAVGEERYHGLGVHRASRIGAAGHGGQVLLSQSTRELLRDDPLPEVRCRDLGLHRLKDLDERERIYQLEAPGLRAEFPPLRTERKRRRVDRRLIPVAVVLVGGAIAAGVLLTRGSSTSAQASAGVAADSVGVFDARNGRLITQAPVGTSPSAVAVGEGAIWVTNVNNDSVLRIDPTTNAVVQTIPVGNGPAGIAVGGDFVWVADSLEGKVSQIDPRVGGGREVQRIAVGNGPAGVAFGEGAIWVANSGDRTVIRIAPNTGMPGAPIPVDAGADGIAVGEGAVWVTSESAGSVARIDPRTKSVVRTVNVGSGANAVAVDAGSVWVANGFDNTVSRIDSVSNRQTDVIPVGAGPSGISVGSDSVWVSNEQGGTLSRINPSLNAVDDTVETGNRPEGVALAGDMLYVAVRTSGLVHRGDRLTVIGSPRPYVPKIDPAVDLDQGTTQVLVLTNDGLTGFKRVAGSEGTRLVADLAISLPAATDGGKTYTFQVRPGIRYSTGELVRPADFRRAIERSLANPSGGGRSLFTGIVGAEACLKTTKLCDLSKGIVVDRDTVTFHLIAPDPDFLFELSVVTAVAVPASTPLEGQHLLPATGPYMIASYDAKRGIRLIRNPHFHEWSAAAQPNGYPDEIVWKFIGQADQDVTAAALRAVERGAADLTFELDPSRLSGVRTQYRSQLHVNPSLSTFYAFLNTRLPPFDDVRVRRAVNYAFDRNRLVDLLGGPLLNQPSCQVLPPNFAGHRRYCPYTIHVSSDGKYTGPDLVKARELVAASGTTGQAVTVWMVKQFVPLGGAYFVSVLRRLGYRARIKLVRIGRAFATTADSRRKVQVGFNGWIADYASPSDFFGPLLSCASYKPRSPANNNGAEFCDRRIDREIARARELQTSDPQAAAALWNRIDREVVDLAPWVVLSNRHSVDFVSSRVGNYTYSAHLGGALLDQLWVR